MKKIILTSVLVCIFIFVNAQSDTLFTKKQEKIPCKIIEITDLDIKYKRADLSDGPVYVINKLSVIKYVLSNGYTELIVPDELSLENEHGNIIKNRSVIKVSPFSMVNEQISLAYEKVIRVGMNFDFELGYSNSNFTRTGGFSGGGNIDNAFNSGFYVKPGVKFFLGQDYSVRGLKYAHPLKGRYIRLDLACSYLNYEGVKRTEYVRNPVFPYTSSYQSISTDISTVSYGGFINYGRQFILGNILTMEYYVGVGFTGQSNSYSNPDYKKSLNPFNNYPYSYDEAHNIMNYHGFIRTDEIGLSFTAGFRVGYILPDRSAKDKKKVNSN